MTGQSARNRDDDVFFCLWSQDQRGRDESKAPQLQPYLLDGEIGQRGILQVRSHPEMDNKVPSRDGMLSSLTAAYFDTLQG